MLTGEKSEDLKGQTWGWSRGGGELRVRGQVGTSAKVLHALPRHQAVAGLGGRAHSQHWRGRPRQAALAATGCEEVGRQGWRMKNPTGSSLDN